ncbi:hypothetical protein V1498_16090 [Peribacillus sp. SCS-26]
MVYRIWILDSREGIKRSQKPRKRFKAVIGLTSL